MAAMPLSAVQGQAPYTSAEVLAEYSRQADPHISATVLSEADPWQLADIFTRISSARAGDILAAMPSADAASEALISMPDGKATDIISGMSAQELETLITNTSPDKAALVLSMAGDRTNDIIEKLPQGVLAQLPADAEHLATIGADPGLANIFRQPAEYGSKDDPRGWDTTLSSGRIRRRTAEGNKDVYKHRQFHNYTGYYYCRVQRHRQRHTIHNVRGFQHIHRFIGQLIGVIDLRCPPTKSRATECEAGTHLASPHTH